MYGSVKDRVMKGDKEVMCMEYGFASEEESAQRRGGGGRGREEGISSIFILNHTLGG